jgi:acetylornithine deacetylase
VVPVKDQAWDSDPFTLTEREGKLYGRGTADMKAFLACCLALAPEWAKQKRDTPIYLAFSYDEEVGCLGAPYLLKFIKQQPIAPDFAIIGEPTLMQVVTAHKGVLSFETVVHGREAHSSQPQLGINAVHIACELVHFLTQLAPEKRDARFTPPYTTVHVGTIAGGTARNIIAKECRFLWEVRPLPGEDADALVEKFTDYCKRFDAEITTTPRSRMLAVTLPERAEAYASRVMHAACTNHQQAVSFGTEAGVFQDHGIPAIICGPGSIDQAHKPNEFIEVGQIGACLEFLQRITS